MWGEWVSPGWSLYWWCRLWLLTQWITGPWTAIEPEIARIILIAILVLKLLCEKCLWKPTVIPIKVKVYILTNSPICNPSIFDRLSNTTAKIEPIKGIKIVPKAKRRCIFCRWTFSIVIFRFLLESLKTFSCIVLLEFCGHIVATRPYASPPETWAQVSSLHDVSETNLVLRKK